MNDLKQHLLDEIPNVDLQLAKKIIISYDKFKREIRGSYCEICGQPISQVRLFQHTSADWNFTCTEHDKYRIAANLDRARQEAGIKDFQIPDLLDF